MSSSKSPPKVIWAQDKEKVFVTICLEDCKDSEIKMEPEKVYFHGTGGTEKLEHEVTIQLYDKVTPEKSTKVIGGRIIEIVLQKEEAGGAFWPRLVKDKKKQHWLSVDFKKWIDGSDSDSSMKQFDPDELNKQLSFGNDSGNFGDGKRQPNLMDLYDEDGEDEEDDEDIPELM